MYNGDDLYQKIVAEAINFTELKPHQGFPLCFIHRVIHNYAKFWFVYENLQYLNSRKL